MTSKKTTIGLIALACGIVGLLFAMDGKQGGLEVHMAAPEPEQLTMKEKGVKLVKEKLLGEDPPPPPVTGWRIGNTVAFGFGIAAAVLGILSFFMRDGSPAGKSRLSLKDLLTLGMAGIGLSLITLLWTYLMAVATVVIIIAVIYVALVMMNGVV